MNQMCSFRSFEILIVLLIMGVAASAQPLPEEFEWKTGAPVVFPNDLPGDSCYSIKDPSIVQYEGKWHLFCTVRCQDRSHAVVYLSIEDWTNANQAKRTVLPAHDGYYCAPQVFYFSPQKKWYLICQAARDDWEPEYQPAFTTTSDIAKPDSWEALTPLGITKPEAAKAWLDFWVICDEDHAFLFFTSLDGKLWRSETSIEDFPHGWSDAELALEGDIFEAVHIYSIRGQDTYIALIEAQHGHGWRYFKAYTARQLDGEWVPFAASKEKTFASMKNVEFTESHWSDSISHGELIRNGYDEQLEIDTNDMKFLFQGVLDHDREGKNYGEIPWRLGILNQN